MAEAYIRDFTRSPIGRHGAALKDVSSDADWTSGAHLLPIERV